MTISKNVRTLVDTLGQVILEQEPPDLYHAEENIRQLAKARRAYDSSATEQLKQMVADLSPDMARGVATAFAVYFDLVNLAEEQNRIRVLRERQRTFHPEPPPESIGAAIKTLAEQGVSPAEMQAIVDSLQIELVLTAHPTEAKRRTMIAKLQRLADQLSELNTHDLLPTESEMVLMHMHAEITELWLTERSRTDKPAVTDEVRTGLFYIEEVFWQAIPQLFSDLDRALAQHYPDVRTNRAWLKLGSWMGGDRDGNPYVTAEVTAETLRLHRGLALRQHMDSFRALSRRLSVSSRRVPAPQTLLDWLDSRRPFPGRVAYLGDRYIFEPFRLTMALLAADLERASTEGDMLANLLDTESHPALAQADIFRWVLDLVLESMPPSVAESELRPLRRQLDIFGLHTARLDLREDSSVLARALGEVLRALNLHPNFESASDAERTELLAELLQQPAPDLSNNPAASRGAAETWALFRLIQRVNEIYGPELLGPFIISMTRGSADVLTVLTLAHWSGGADGLWIVPLFETQADLDSARQTLTTLFTLPTYRQHLESCGNAQMVMIGYSDSNKDAGFISANWALYQAQENIASICTQHSISLTLFHGRGGTVARGGGPANRAIKAQPPGTVNGHFRVTEQGEVIANRYGNVPLAHRHLEQITNAVLLSSAPAAEARTIPKEWRAAMESISLASSEYYRELVYRTPEFMIFWQQATPLDEIKRLRIGSRPSARGAAQGGPPQVTSIRAIPWVFSWMQSRFNLPGWYGMGTGFDCGVPSELLQQMYREWPFFKALIDNTEMSLMKADIGIAAQYAELVEEVELRNRIFHQIENEYMGTREFVLEITGHEALMAADPTIQNSIHLRNPYVDPLNFIQIEMLQRLRALDDPDGPDSIPLREVMVMTINGIAAGLRNTG